MIEKESKVAMNSVAVYVLPMLQLNKSSFGTNNLINAYVDKAGYIIAQVEREPVTDFSQHEYYVTDYNKEDGSLMLVFSIPEDHVNDMELFIKGKYSQLSPALKIAITKDPNLKAGVTRNLNPSKEDRQKLADELHVKVDLITELKSAPEESNYISIR